MRTSKNTSLIYALLLTFILWLTPGQLQAQTFGSTPITVDNINELSLMASTNHPYLAITALSPDGRWLAVARQLPEPVGGGGGDGPPPYMRPYDQRDAAAILIHDLQNLTDEPQVLTGNNYYVKQMTFTDSRLLLLTSDSEEDQRLQSWELEGTTFANSQVLIEDVDTAFAVDAADTWIVYYYEGALYYSDWRQPAIQLGASAFNDAPVFENPVSLSASTTSTNQPYAVALDQAGMTTFSNLDKPPQFLIRSIEETSRGAGQPLLYDVNILFGDDTTIRLDVQVATRVVVDTALYPVVDYTADPEWHLLAAIVADEDETLLQLWDIRAAFDVEFQLPTEPLLTIPRENLTQVIFSEDGTRLITVAGHRIEIWSVADNLLTPNAAHILSQQNILAYCGRTYENPESYPPIYDFGIVWSWYASEESLVYDHIYNAHYDVRIDGAPIYHWVFPTQIRRASENNNDPTVYYYAPIDKSLSAALHSTDYTLTWWHPISDGYETFGPGTNIPENTGVCYFDLAS